MVKPQRRKVEQLYATHHAISVECAHMILIHDKKLYKQWRLKVEY